MTSCYPLADQSMICQVPADITDDWRKAAWLALAAAATLDLKPEAARRLLEISKGL